MPAVMRTQLDALATALATITTGNGYFNTVAHVAEGPAPLSNIPDKPAVVFYCDSRARSNFSGGRSRSFLHILLWGFIEVQEGDYDNMDNLEADVESLLSTWTYKEWTNIVNISRSYGGTNPLIGIFEMEMLLQYNYTEGSP